MLFELSRLWTTLKTGDNRPALYEGTIEERQGLEHRSPGNEAVEARAMFGSILAAGRYMANAWDRGATIGAFALGLTILTQLVQPYFSNTAEQATKIGVVLDNQEEFKKVLDEDRKDNRLKEKENSIAHEATRTRVTIVEQAVLNFTNRVGELVKEIKEVSSKIDRIEARQKAETDEERHQNPFALK